MGIKTKIATGIAAIWASPIILAVSIMLTILIIVAIMYFLKWAYKTVIKSGFECGDAADPAAIAEANALQTSGGMHPGSPYYTEPLDNQRWKYKPGMVEKPQVAVDRTGSGGSWVPGWASGPLKPARSYEDLATEEDNKDMVIRDAGTPDLARSSTATGLIGFSDDERQRLPQEISQEMPEIPEGIPQRIPQGMRSRYTY
jgi:hypothetical protein